MLNMKQYTPEQFADKTGLLPHLVAEKVLSQTEVLAESPQGTWFIEHVERRTVHIYNRNKRFRKSLNGVNSREELYMFVWHWLDGYLKSPESYVQRCPHTLFSALRVDKPQNVN